MKAANGKYLGPSESGAILQGFDEPFYYDVQDSTPEWVGSSL